jgi:DNA polymerase-3 subunit gamma/tau
MDYKAWYRQWRPEVFDKVIGQEPIVRTLRNQVKSERIAHAYLFCGPRGTGKTSVARILAHAANCLSPIEGSPCGKCVVCENFPKGDMDIVEIDAASNNGVDDIRELRDRVKYPPVNGRYKVYIIDEVHMLSIGAFNALLKTLEEPPGHILFIFATTESHKLPTTILSRCQRFNFRRIPHKSIVAALKNIADDIGMDYESTAFETIAMCSEGSLRDAISLLDQCNAFKGEVLTNDDVLSVLGTIDIKAVFTLAKNLLSGDIPALLRQIASIIDAGGDMATILKDLVNHLRNVLIFKMCDKPETILEAYESYKTEYLSQAQAVSLQKLSMAIEQLSSIESEMRWSTQPRVLFEITLIKICRQESPESLSSLALRIQNLENKLAEINLSGNQRIAHAAIMSGDETTSFTHKAEPTMRGQADFKKVTSGKQEQKPISAQSAAKDKDPLTEWPLILKTVKGQRESMYGLLADVKVELGTKNELMLLFPVGMDFNAELAGREENRKFLEEIISKVCAKQYTLKLKVKEMSKPDRLSSAENPLVQRAYELFGKENVEIIDD